MSGAEEHPVRRPRVVARPQVPPGPLRELKDLLYELYLIAGTPTLDQIAKLISKDNTLAGAPERDTIRRCLASAELPANQHDVVAVATVLARVARWDEHDAAVRARQLWVQAKLAVPVGQLITQLTDPLALEVHPAIKIEAKIAGLAVLPVYIPREHDARLGEIVQQAAAGRSTIAILIGGSSTGKTRAWWEAIRSLPEGWRLWHPLEPGRPEAAIRALPQIGPRTVMWLNETQHYLLTPGKELGEHLAAGLRELLRDPRRGPILVLGTIWPEPWAILTTAPVPGQDDPHAQARALLTGADIGVPEAFTGTDLTALRAAVDDDPRLAQAQIHAQNGQITQFLAGVPALLERYRNAPASAKALIEAAMDARRLGHSPALPRSLLEAAVAASLTDQQWNELGEDWLEHALAYTAARCRGVCGPLIPIRRRPGQPVADQPYYRLSDYLEQHGRITRWAHSVTAAFWDALVTHATREDFCALGWQAKRRGLFRYAFRLYEAAAVTGDIAAFRPAAELLIKAGRTEEAITYFRRAADAGDLAALRPAAELLVQVGRAEEAITWLQVRGEVGDTALREAVELLVQAGRAEEAITWLQVRAEAGDTFAFWLAAELLAEVGRAEEAITCLQRAAEAGGIAVLLKAAKLLVQVGQIAETITWSQVCAEVGDTAAPPEAAELLAQVEQTEETIASFQRTAEAGDTIALRDAAALLVEVRRTEEAITSFQRAAEAGDTTALQDAAALLVQFGRTEQAITWLQTGAKLGRAHLLRWGVAVMFRGKRTEEAITSFERAIEAGNTAPLRRAAALLVQVGRTEDAVRLRRYEIEPGG